MTSRMEVAQKTQQAMVGVSLGQLSGNEQGDNTRCDKLRKHTSEIRNHGVQGRVTHTEDGAFKDSYCAERPDVLLRGRNAECA